MSYLSEDKVAHWLTANGFAIARGLLAGRKEIDFVGVRFQGREVDRVHVEATVSGRATGEFGWQRARKQGHENATNYQKARDRLRWMFYDKDRVAGVVKFLGTEDYRRMLVLGDSPDRESVARACRNLGIELIDYATILRNLKHWRKLPFPNAGARNESYEIAHTLRANGGSA